MGNQQYICLPSYSCHCDGKPVSKSTMLRHRRNTPVTDQNQIILPWGPTVENAEELRDLFIERREQESCFLEQQMGIGGHIDGQLDIDHVRDSSMYLKYVNVSEDNDDQEMVLFKSTNADLQNSVSVSTSSANEECEARQTTDVRMNEETLSSIASSTCSLHETITLFEGHKNNGNYDDAVVNSSSEDSHGTSDEKDTSNSNDHSLSELEHYGEQTLQGTENIDDDTTHVENVNNNITNPSSEHYWEDTSYEDNSLHHWIYQN